MARSMSVKRRYEQMTDEDKECSTCVDFEQMMNEMDDQMLKFVNMVTTPKQVDGKDALPASRDEIAIIDAAMATAHDAISEGAVLLEKAEQRLRRMEQQRL